MMHLACGALAASVNAEFERAYEAMLAGTPQFPAATGYPLELSAPRAPACDGADSAAPSTAPGIAAAQAGRGGGGSADAPVGRHSAAVWSSLPPCAWGEEPAEWACEGMPPGAEAEGVCVAAVVGSPLALRAARARPRRAAASQQHAERQPSPARRRSGVAPPPRVAAAARVPLWPPSTAERPEPPKPRLSRSGSPGASKARKASLLASPGAPPRPGGGTLPPHPPADAQCCPICWEGLSVSDPQRTELRPCAHAYHGACITPWLASQNTCPQCRVRVTARWEALGGEAAVVHSDAFRKVMMPLGRMPYDDTICQVCHDGGSEDVMLLCDGCDKGFHTHCVQLRLVPRGAWHCRRCRRAGAEAALLAQSDSEE